MRKSLLGLLSVLTLVFGLTVLSCEVGLGSQVDTKWPDVTLDFPKTSGQVIKGDFTLSGSWNDDSSIESIDVKIRRSDNCRVSIKEQPVGVITKKADDKSGKWTCDITPKSMGLIDGQYDIDIIITDAGKHPTTKTCSVVIDNTPPLIVLERPSTLLDAKEPDVYGKILTLIGQAADDNNVDRIEVNFYSDPSCKDEYKLLKDPVTHYNVPNTINLDIAKHGEETYTTLYGTDNSAGTKPFYCKIKAYDSAVQYDKDGNKISSGNVSENYYLYDAIYKDVLSKFKINEVYKMLNGNYNLQTVSKSALNDSESILKFLKEKLYPNKQEISSFSLNPQNNPTYSIIGYSPIVDYDGTSFLPSADDYKFSNGNKLMLELIPGFDGTPFEPDFKIYAYKWSNDLQFENDGRVKKDTASGILLYDSSKSDKEYPGYEYKKSGQSYKIGANLQAGDNFDFGNYIIEVKGCDQKEVPLIPYSDKMMPYGIIFEPKNKNIEIKFTTPSEKEFYVVPGDSILLTGTVICAEPCNFELIDDKGTTSINLTEVDKKAGKYSFNYNYVVHDPNPEILVEKSIDLQFKASLKSDNSVDLIEKIKLQYDAEKPTCTLQSYPNSTDSTKADKFTISGTASDGNGSGIKNVEITITDILTKKSKTVPAIGKDEWSYTLNYDSQVWQDIFATEGEKELKVIVNDNNRNSSDPEKDKTVQTIKYDKADPELNVTTKVASYSKTFFDLEGTASDSYKLKSVIITETGKKVDIDADGSITLTNTNESKDITSLINASGNWKVSLPLCKQDGIYEYSIEAEDSVGNTTKLKNNIEVTIDTKDPVVKYSVEKSKVKKDNQNWFDKVSLTAYVYDIKDLSGISKVQTIIGDKETVFDDKLDTATNNIYYEGSITLPDQGKNTIKYIITDKAGHTIEKTEDVYIDSVKPVVTVNPASVLTYMPKAGFNYRGTATDGKDNTEYAAKPLVLTVKEEFKDIGGEYVETTESKAGKTININTDGSWTQKVPLGTIKENGVYKYTFSLVDIVDNKALDLVYEPKIDTKAPSVVIKNPNPDGTSTKTGAIHEKAPLFAGEIEGIGEGTAPLAAVWYKIIDQKGADPSAPVATGEESFDELKWTSAGWKQANKQTTTWDFYQSCKEGVSDSDNLGEGSYKLCVFALDEAGNLSEKVKTAIFDVDMEAPVLTENSSVEKVNASRIGEGQDKNLTIGGTIKETNHLVSLEVSCKSLTESQTEPKVSVIEPLDGSWGITYKVGASKSSDKNYLKDGKYEFTITAKDIADKTTTLIRTVDIDTVVPSVNGDSLKVPEPKLTELPSFKFGGIVSDGETYSSGFDVVEFYFTDKDGNNKTEILKPGVSKDNDSFKWTYPFTFKDYFAKNNEYIEGEKILHVKVIDNVGNTSDEVTKSFMFDISEPTLEETSIKNSLVTKEGFTLSGTIKDTNGLVGDDYITIKSTRIDINNSKTETIYNSKSRGLELKPTADGKSYTWSLTVPKVEKGGNDGVYNYVITAKDAAGKTVEVKRDVTLDTVAPVATATLKNTSHKHGEENWYETSAVTIEIVGIKEVSGIEKANAIVDSKETTLTKRYDSENNEYFDGEISVTKQGLNQIDYSLSDRAGNTFKGTFDVYVDTVKPILTVNNDTVLNYMPSAGFIIKGKATDENPTGKRPLTLKIKEEFLAPGSNIYTETEASKKAENSIIKINEDNTWECKVPLGKAKPTNGSYKYTIELSDLVGNKAAPVTYQTTVDAAKPVISITSLDKATGVNSIMENNPRFAGNVEGVGTGTAPLAAVWYKIIGQSDVVPIAPVSDGAPINSPDWGTNGWTASNKGNSTWAFYKEFKAGDTKDEKLGEGKYKLCVAAVDEAGNVSAVESKDFDVDMSRPTITETSVKNSIITKQSFTLSGEISDTNKLAAENFITIKQKYTNIDGVSTESTLEGITTEAIGGSRNYRWSKEISVGAKGANDGKYEFTITATDIQGKTTTLETRYVTLDTVAPVATLTWNEPQYTRMVQDLKEDWYNMAQVSLKVDNIKDVSGVSIAKVTVNTKETQLIKKIDINGNTYFEGDIALPKQGENILTYSIEDEAKNAITGSKVVYADTEKPVLTVNAGSVLNYMPQAGFTINGQASDDTADKTSRPLTLVVHEFFKTGNGEFAETNESKAGKTISVVNEQWKQKVPFGTIQNGVYKYSFELSDSVGHKAPVVTYQTTVDNEKPVISVTVPENAIGVNAIMEKNPRFAGNVTGVGEGTAPLAAVWYKIFDNAVVEKNITIPTESVNSSSNWAAMNWSSASKGNGSWEVYKEFKSGKTDSTKNILGEGSYIIYVCAVDEANNVSEIESKEFDVDMSVPEITETASNGKTLFNAESVKTDKGKSITFGGTVKDSNPQAIQSVKYILDNSKTELNCTFDKTSGKWSQTFNISSSESAETTIGEGDHTIIITATDAMGKVSSITKKFVVDTIAPIGEGKVVANTSGWNNDSLIKINVNNVQEYGQGILSIIGKFYKTTETKDKAQSTTLSKDIESTESNNYKGLINITDGKYNIYFELTDKAGNTTTTDPIEIKVDTIAPTITETNKTPFTKDGITLKGMATDGNKIGKITITDKCGTEIKYTFGDTSNGSNNKIKYNETTNEWSLDLTNEDLAKDGLHEISIVATDKTGKDSVAVKRDVRVDRVAPTGDFSFVSKPTYTKDTHNGYNTNQITVKFADVKEDGSSMESIKAFVNCTETDAKESNTFTFANTGTNEYTGTITLQEGKNNILFVLKDIVGNKTTITNTVYVDSINPEKPTSNITGTKLVNGSEDLTVEITAKDSNKNNSIPSGIKSVEIVKVLGNDVTGIIQKTGDNDVYTLTIDKEKFETGSGPVMVDVTDNAGNVTSFNAFTLTVDKEKPKTKINNVKDADPTTTEIEVNKTIVISGSASDNFTLKSVQLYVSKDNKATWEKYGTEITDNPYTWNVSVDTTQLNVEDGTHCFFRAIAKDEANNETDDKAPILEVIVNQDTDIPIISLNDVKIENSLITLKDKLLLTGLIRDDDGIESFEYKVDGGAWKSFGDVSNGSWKLNLSECKESVYDFRIVDKDGSEFVLSNETLKPKVKDTTDIVIDNQSVIKITADKTAPTIDTTKYEYFDGTKWQDYTDGTLLGCKNSKFRITLTVNDNYEQGKAGSGIKGVSFDGKELQTSGFVYEIDTRPVSEVDRLKDEWNGLRTIPYKVVDNVDHETNGEISISLDNIAPEIEITKPATEDGLLSGIVTAYGNINDPTSKLYYAVTKVTGGNTEKPGAAVKPTAKQYKEIKDKQLSWFVYFDGDIDSSKTSAHEKNVNDLINELYFENKEDMMAYNTITELGFWLKAVDSVGNEKVISTKMKIDPQGDRPKIEVSNPDPKALATPTVGGTLKYFGSCSDTKGIKTANIGVNNIWLQLISAKTAGRTGYDGTTFTLTEADVKLMNDVAKFTVKEGNVYNRKTGTKWNGILPTGESFDDYAIKVNVVDGSSWSYEINRDKLFDPAESDTEAVAVNLVAARVYAEDKDGKFSLPTDCKVQFDSSRPIIDELFLEQGEGLNKVSKAYTPDMFVSGNWSLTGRVRDNDGIKSVMVGKDTITTKPIDDFEGYKTYTFEIPLKDKGQFKIEAEDNAGKTREYEISINFDNVAPKLVETTDKNYRISENVQQYNSFYTFGSRATEDVADNGGNKQSGVDFIAVYFMRGDNIINPLYKAGNSIAKGNNFAENLYWQNAQILTKGASDNVFTLAKDNGNIHASGLVKVNGTIFKITNKTGNSITLSGNPKTADKYDASFANALLIENTVQETGTGVIENGYFNKVANDDGDKIVEVVNKTGSAYDWEGSICSKFISDGPIELHYVVFDKAGNSSAATVIAKVCNNNPRIAGVKILTDYNNNGIAGEIDEDEIINDLSITQAVNYKQFWTSGTEGDPSDHVFDWDARVQGKLTKNPIPMNRTMGDEKVAAAKIRGLTKIIPEIIGGNDAIYYSYNLGKDYMNSNGTLKAADTDKTTLPELKGNSGNSAIISKGSTDNTVVTADEENAITIQQGDLIRTRAGGITPFEFTFWDSTPGSKKYVNSLSATVKIYLDVIGSKAVAPTINVNDLFWTSEKENSLYKQSRKNGHIELAADWATAYNKLSKADKKAVSIIKSTTVDKVSGKIEITGTVTCPTPIDIIYLNVPKMSAFGSDYKAVYDSATYKTKDEAKIDEELNANGYSFVFVNKTGTAKTGYNVDWKLYWDTSKVDGTAAAGVELNFKAACKTNPQLNGINKPSDTMRSIDGKTTYSAYKYDTTVNDSPKSKTYDVVPYIESLTRDPSFVTERTKSGAVSLARLEAGLRFNGFNLPIESSKIKGTLGSTNIAIEYKKTDADSYYTFGIPENAKSGDVKVVVNSIPDINAYNNNTKEYNKEKGNAFGGEIVSDDRYIHVWRVDDKDIFQGTMKCEIPTMAKDPHSKKLFAAFSNGGFAQIFVSPKFRGSEVLKQEHTTDLSSDVYKQDITKNIKRIYSSFAVPTNLDICINNNANGTNLNVDVAYGPAYRAYEDTNWADKVNGTYTKNDFGGGVYVYGDKFVTETGNQSKGTLTDLGKGTLAYKAWRGQLYCYDQVVDQFKNIKTARSGDYVFTAYYDKFNKSVNFGATNTTFKRGQIDAVQNAGLPWVCIDGKPFEEFKAGVKVYNNVEMSGGLKPGAITQYGTPYNLTDNAFNDGEKRTDRTGEYVGLAVDKNGLPVIVYSDFETGNIRIATSISKSGTLGFIETKAVGTIIPTGAAYAGKGVWKDNTTQLGTIYRPTSNGKPIDYGGLDQIGGIDITQGKKKTNNGDRSDYWKVQEAKVSGFGFAGGYLDCAIDKDNHLHIIYRTNTGKLMYMKSTSEPNIVDSDITTPTAYAKTKTDYVFTEPVVIDNCGTNISMSIEKQAEGTLDIPYISYIGTPDSVNGLKIAFPMDLNGDGTIANDEWETMVAPSTVTIKDAKTSIENDAYAFDYDEAATPEQKAAIATYKAAVGVYTGDDFRALFYTGEDK